MERPATWNSDCSKRPDRYRWRAHYRSQWFIQGSRSHPGRRDCAPPEGCRCGVPWKAQPPRIRLRRQLCNQLFRPGSQSLESRLQPRRLVRRICCGCRSATLLWRDWFRHWRFDSPAGRLLRRRRTQTDLRTREYLRRHTSVVVPGSLGGRWRARRRMPL